ncbi:probable LRR receptor-like serine/threonine-protein kinase At2g16250 [Neltuma alba]|uniref:probable LRR receptor-like serine/threonine-protein kinase At2g16250 n=1 Tax=Neltuma alba TaxID=207710 RepID=UPI0010A5161A|nr:probable LRR receptor-like serine/threonine-protein kinase At2g16250 [Prosopis alba]
MVDHRRNILSLGFLFLLLFQFTFEQLEPLSSPAERLALLQLRSSLGLRSREWPIKADPCLIWNGIRCENGRVTGVNISGFRRTRLGRQNPQFSVDALANLTFLQSFNASKFLLPGPVPHWFGQKLSSLKVLDLRYCSIIGAIPSTLGNLTSLTTLYLSDNNLTGIIPDSLSQLAALSVLDLSRNFLSGSLPDSFAFLGNLSFLDISSNYLSGSIPQGTGAISKLQYLNLSNNGLTSSIPAQLGDLSNLVDLDLSDNYLFGLVPPDLMGLRSLQRMKLGNNILDGPLPENSFHTTSELQFIELRQNNFTGALPDRLWYLPRLSFVDVSSNKFTGVLPSSSSSANATPTVKGNFSHNLFYGSITPLLKRFSFIDLSSNYFEGKVLDFAVNASLGSNCLQNVSNQRATEECLSFYSRRGLSFHNFGQANMTRPRAAESSGKNNGRKFILAGILGGVGLIAVLVLLILRTRKRSKSNNTGARVGAALAGGNPAPTDALIELSKAGDSFTYQQLLKATGNFSDANLIKHGHTGDLFNGVLESGISVVIKRIDLRSTENENAYMSELDLFSKVSHPRLVPLFGHCLENDKEKFLVYKHMPNGDLLNCMRNRETTHKDGTLQSLDWITRLKISIGTAEALCFLHHECNPPFVHRDIQATSVLLDDKYEVRLGSLSEACTQGGDTHQRRISRLLRLPQSSDQGSSGSSSPAVCAYDVYCFGKVLLEMVTGKLGIGASGDAQVKEWLEQTLPYVSIYDKDLVTKIVDPSMVVDEDFLEEVRAVAIIARSCLNPKPSRRPQMRYVLKALENPLKVIREESYSSARLRTTSSRGSWNAALFASWRQNSDITVVPAVSGSRAEEGQLSSSRRRRSNEIVPEPSSSIQEEDKLE